MPAKKRTNRSDYVPVTVIMEPTPAAKPIKVKVVITKEQAPPKPTRQRTAKPATRREPTQAVKIIVNDEPQTAHIPKLTKAAKQRILDQRKAARRR